MVVVTLCFYLYLGPRGKGNISISLILMQMRVIKMLLSKFCDLTKKYFFHLQGILLSYSYVSLFS